jgi:CBS domain-containing protein
MPIGDYCRREPVTATPGESIQDVARRLDAEGVGCAIVVDAERRPVGVATDRDIALRVLRRGLDPATTEIQAVMHEPAVTMTRNAPLAVAGRFMRQNGLRRIPVVESDSGALFGVIASDDLLQLAAAELSACAAVARQQFPAEPADHALPPEGGI